MKSMWDFAKGTAFILILLAFLFSAAVRSCLLPFAVALLIARWADRPVSRLSQQLPRWLSALLILTISGLLLCCLVLLLMVKLGQDVPVVLEGSKGGVIWRRLESLAATFPGFLQGGARWLLEQAQTQSSALRTHLNQSLAQWAADWAGALPGILFAWGITVLAAFYAASDWKRVHSALIRMLPQGWEQTIRMVFRRLMAGAKGWLRVQGRLMVITFGILGIGFLILDIPGGWTLALVIAFADALPVFGSGILLLPWAGLSLLQGEGWIALGLVCLWIIAALLRSVLEPRFLGKQAGASPLVTLLVMYAGLRLFGIGGLILGPIALSAGIAAVRGTETAA